MFCAGETSHVVVWSLNCIYCVKEIFTVREIEAVDCQPSSQLLKCVSNINPLNWLPKSVIGDCARAVARWELSARFPNWLESPKSGSGEPGTWVLEYWTTSRLGTSRCCLLLELVSWWLLLARLGNFLSARSSSNDSPRPTTHLVKMMYWMVISYSENLLWLGRLSLFFIFW